MGVLNGTAPAGQNQIAYDAFLRRLSELGWTDGRNVRIEVRWANSDPALMRTYGAELAAHSPDVFLVQSNPALSALRQLAGNTPIVFVHVADPVGSGFVASLARPGGNITGFTNFEPSMGSKWLEVLREVAPSTTRALVLMHPETTAHKEFWQTIEQVADPIHIQAVPAGVHNEAEIERAVAEFGANRHGGVIALPHPVTEVHRDLIIQQATSRLLPAVFAFAAHASAGALVTYGIDLTDAMLQTTEYVDRILRGTKPADLPVQAPKT